MGLSAKKIVALAYIILLDGLRRHALIGLLALCLVAQAGGLLFFDFMHRDIGRASSDFIFSVSWAAGFIFLFFHAVHALSWDEERHVIHTLLARPLSRAEYVVGIFCGLGALLLLLNLILGAIGWAILFGIRHSVDPAYFAHFSTAYYALAWLGLFAMQLMMLAVIVLFSGLIRGGFAVLLVSLCFYLICSGLPVVRETVAQQPVGTGVSSGQRFLQGMTAIFPDFGRLDYKNAVVAEKPGADLRGVFTDFGLTISYLILTLWLACLVYRRRDLQ